MKKKHNKYVQCMLQRDNGTSSSSITTFVPEKFAIEGRCVKIMDDDGTWLDGWIVKKVHSTIVFDMDDLLKVEAQHKNHRKVSDI